MSRSYSGYRASRAKLTGILSVLIELDSVEEDFIQPAFLETLQGRGTTVFRVWGYHSKDKC